MKRAVITGIGPVSAVGIGVEAFRAGLHEGRPRVGAIRSFPVPAGAPTRAAEIPGFQVDSYLKTPKTYLDRNSAFSFAALHLALSDAALPLEKIDLARTGLFLGSAFGCLATMNLFYEGVREKGPRLAKPVLFPHAYPNTSISLLAIEYGIKGEHLAFSSGGTASGHALLAALDAIRTGRADTVLAGGAEALCAPLLAGFARAGRLALDAAASIPSCPFDSSARGMVLGEGAAILVIEERDAATQRGARVYAELAGAGAASDAAPSPAAIERAMRDALIDASLTPASLSAVYAAANALPASDRAEAVAISDLLHGADVPVTAVKSLTGETLGAGAALNAAAALVSLAGGWIPATAGFSALPAGLALRVSNARLQHPGNAVLVNSTDPGGSVVSLVLRPPGAESGVVP